MKSGPAEGNYSMERGTYEFDVSEDGNLTNTAANVDLLRKLWLDRSVISGDDLGPGDPGDFDHGAWHVACHVSAACGVRQRVDGNLAWLQISHDDRADRYFASVTVLEGGNTHTAPTDWPKVVSCFDSRAFSVLSKVPRRDGRRPALPMIRPACSICGGDKISINRRITRKTAEGSGSIGAPSATSVRRMRSAHRS